MSSLLAPADDLFAAVLEPQADSANLRPDRRWRERFACGPVLAMDAAMHQTSNGRRPLVLLSVALVALIVNLGGCVVPGAVVCSDGRTCPSGTRCDDNLKLCVTDLQMHACDNLHEGDACRVVDAPGLCRGGVCNIFYCGDGQRDSSEACDGADLNGKTCAALGFYEETTGLKCHRDLCTFDTSGCADECGDDKINGKELCDGSDLGGADCRTAGFYEAAGLRCAPSCTLDVSACRGSCGDKIINGPETCDGAPTKGKTCVDYGFDRGALGCSSVCVPQLDGCSQIGWRSVLSTDYPVIAVWGSSRNDVFAVGWGGTIARGSGSSWAKMTSNTTANLWGVWGSGPDHVFAVGGDKGPGSGVVLLWDGVSWKDLHAPASGLYSSVWGSGPDDVFVMNRYDDVVVHWDGKGWTNLPPFPPTRGAYTEYLWGSGPNDLYAIGDGILRWDGTKWSQSWKQPEFVPLQAIWGSGPRDIFAVAPGFILHWDGMRWSQTNVDPSLSLGGIGGTGPKDVFAVGVTNQAQAKLLHWNGTTWSDAGHLDDVHLVRQTVGMWASSPDETDLYIAGLGGLRHGNGDAWDTTAPAKLSPSSLWAAGPDDLFVFGNGPPDMMGIAAVTLVTRTSQSTTVVSMSTVSGGKRGLDDTGTIWGTSVIDVFALTSSSIQHWDGVRWSPSYVIEPSESGAAVPVGVWGSGPANVYAVGCASIVRWDGSQWSTLPLSLDWGGGCLTAVWVSSEGEVFAVGDGGAIVHSNGTTWSVMSSGSTSDLSSVWGSGPRDVFAVGDAGTILHFDGTGWRAMPSGTTKPLGVVRGSGPADVFVIGDDTLLHLRAGAWETIVKPWVSSMTALWVTPQRVFLAGGKDQAGAAVITRLDRSGVTCVGPERNCRDGWDNDCDGRADIADADCAGKVPEQCANLLDDDANGMVDCADPACTTLASCRNR